MKKIILAALLLSGLLSVACTATTQPSPSSVVQEQEQEQDGPAVFDVMSYTWFLKEGPASLRKEDKVSLQFTPDGLVGVSGLCNRMGGSFSLSGTTLVITDVVSTMMACTDARKMRLEGEVGQVISGSHSVSMDTDTETAPEMKMKMKDGKTWLFAGNKRAGDDISDIPGKGLH